jgi:hypothetical protein
MTALNSEIDHNSPVLSALNWLSTVVPTFVDFESDLSSWDATVQDVTDHDLAGPHTLPAPPIERFDPDSRRSVSSGSKAIRRATAPKLTPHSDLQVRALAG